MKFDFVAALAAGLIVLFLGMTVGSMSNAHVTTEMPHGLLEYWTNRYQTVLVSLVAVVGLVGVSHQVRAARHQAKASLLVAHKPTFDGLTRARSFLLALRRLCEHIDIFQSVKGTSARLPVAPSLSESTIELIQVALPEHGYDPFGVAFYHREYKAVESMFSQGKMNAEDMLAMIHFIRAGCDNAIRDIDRRVELLHAEIDVSS